MVPHPFTYEIYRNATLIFSANWAGGLITINIDGLSVGSYNYTIEIHDKAGNTNRDTVIVTVVAQGSTTTTTTTTTTTPTTTTTTSPSSSTTPSDDLGGLITLALLQASKRS
ncbi:MAG: TcfC E-set like domain-containing protein [Candidatus Thorarchaeota archaeon]|nr:TcfC E-set like domain-containing protein [Candidatus Thorarchaeota archaeon]